MATKPTAKTARPATKPAVKTATKAAPAKKAASTPVAKAKAGTSGAGKSARPESSGPATTVTLKQIAAALADQHAMQRKQAEGVLGDVVGLIVGHLTKGERIRLAGLGILEVKNRAARMGRNPATGAAIEIKASKKIAFRPAKELKAAV